MFKHVMSHPLVAHLRTQCSRAYGVLAIRLSTGAIFAYHGYGKLFGGLEQTTGFFDKIGIPAAGFMAPFVGVLEFVGGLALILGVGTRLWAMGHVAIMLVAIFVAKGISKFSKIEIDVSLLGASLFLFLHGAGRYSVDAWLMNRKSEEKKM
jgi:uncharacterized membrane protein YphA (DoxX/SURF4 family)